ncbi:MAG: ATP-binding cassette domain-containing protein [Chloroflexota bacterium]
MSLLKLNQLSKTFGTLKALTNISLDMFSGEVVGLAGPSGSGKSVLTNILASLEPPTSGEVWFLNKRLQFPWKPRRLGIEFIFQEPEFADQLDITSNIFLGSELGWRSIPNQTQMDQIALSILGDLGIRFGNLREKIINLPSEQRQLIAIARVMAQKPKLIVVDEPTDLLRIRYQQTLLDLIHRWRDQNRGIMFASNNLDHLFAVTDRILIMQEGKITVQLQTDETSREELVSAIVGKYSRSSVTPAIWALDRYYRAREQAEKLQDQQSLLQKDLAAQDTLNQQLVEELAIQVRALDEANLALQNAQRRLMIERELERKHLARELHDQVIQDLLSTNYQLEELERATNSQMKAELNNIRQNIRGLVEDVRHICGDLRPPTIDSLGLGAAIKSFTRDWQERTRIELELVISPQLGRLPEAIELSVFRIVQEGLNNVWRHAGANQVMVSLDRTSPRTLVLSITDDGRGLPPEFDLSQLSTDGHYGLLGISERVALLAGRLRLKNMPEGGAMLQVEIPHPRIQSGR